MIPRRGPEIEPRTLRQIGESGVEITWADGHICEYSAPALRRACPCAQCVNEWTGERMLSPVSISEELKIVDLSLVGRYAINFKWSDRHETGIYSFQLLRELCELNNLTPDNDEISDEGEDVANT
jgi:DUF971 family protein